MRDKLNDTARLELMLEAISNIESFVEDTLTYEAFAANKILCHAVTYNLQCIGENVYKLSKDFIQEHPETDWEAIEGLRHVLVHDYYQANMEMIWLILKQDLPGLKENVRNLLRNSP
jgi:uncharacterized protein with HEPN domain